MEGSKRGRKVFDAVPGLNIPVALGNVQVEATCGWREAFWLLMTAIPCLGLKKMMTDCPGVPWRLG